jgi:hypothetical protein
MQKLFSLAGKQTIHEITPNVTKHDVFVPFGVTSWIVLFVLTDGSYHHNTSASRKRNTPAPIKTQNAFGR